MADEDLAWLVDASYSGGVINLEFIRCSDLERISWTDTNFHPYYLTDDEQHGEPVKKRTLFGDSELTLHKLTYTGRPPKNVQGWELEIDPAMSYVYDKGLRFGVSHRFEGNSWLPQTSMPIS